MSNFKDVQEFHAKFRLLLNRSPKHLTRRKLQERIDFLHEEWTEFVEGADEQDLAKQADALIDMVYVAMGTAVMMGLPWEQLWEDVHQANMRKVRGVGKRNHKVDCIKPEGWEGPRTDEILYINGYIKDYHSREEQHRDDAEE